MRGSLALCAWVLLIPVCCGAATLHETVKKGADLYAQGKYDEALTAFVDGQIEHPEDAQLKYNIASSKYMMKNYEEALKGYLDVAATARDARLEEKALFNAGNALYRQGKLEEAIEYYKKALELDPADKDALQNIEFVREEIKRRMNEAKDTQQKQQQQEQQKDQTCKNPQQDNQTQSDGQQTAQQGQKQEDQQAQQDKEQEQRQEGQQQQEGRQLSPAEGEKAPQDDRQQGASDDIREMSTEEAQQWLDSVRENRDNLKEGRLPARTQGGARSGKDW